KSVESANHISVEMYINIYIVIAVEYHHNMWHAVDEEVRSPHRCRHCDDRIIQTRPRGEQALPALGLRTSGDDVVARRNALCNFHLVAVPRCVLDHDHSISAGWSWRAGHNGGGLASPQFDSQFRCHSGFD